MNDADNTGNQVFGEVSASYAQYRPSYPAELFEYLDSVAGPVDRAWDCATGNGQAAVDLADIADSVVATDIDERQLAHAFDHPDVDYRVAPAEDSGLPDASVDLAVVATALHWFDLDAFFRELDRVLVDGGCFAAWCYNSVEVDDRVDALVERLTDELLDEDWDPRVAHIRNAYADIELPVEEIEAPDFTCTMEWTFEELRGFLSTWSALQIHIDRFGEESLRESFDELEDAWGDPNRLRTVRVPLFTRVGFKR